MEFIDCTLNDFQIKFITSQCPNFQLFFELSDPTSFTKVPHHIIHIYDTEDIFCQCIQTFGLNKENMRWKKIEVEQLVNLINNATPAPHIKFVGQPQTEYMPQNCPNYTINLP